MIIKVCQFQAKRESGERLVQVFQPGQIAEAEQFFSGMRKEAAPLLPDVRRYLEKLRPDPRKIYVLVNALGAGEFWGSNINGDYFPEAALIHEGPEYGYKTFYNAHPYKHHCFPAGTPVLMADRTRKPIEQVCGGEAVMTLNGPRHVIDTMRRHYSGDGIALRLRGEYKELVGTADHPVLIYRRDQIHCRCNYSRLSQSGHEKDCVEYRKAIGDPEYVPMAAVLPGDYMVIPKPEHGREPVDEAFAKLVGWVAAEGNLGAHGLIQFCFSDRNKEDISAVSACMSENGLHVTVTPRPQDGLVQLSACSAKTHAELSRYITGVLSEKRLTEEVLKWDETGLRWMLGTYIDGDGHLPQTGKNAGQLQIRSSSPQMLRILSDVIRSLGHPATIQWDAEPREMTSPTNGEVYMSSGSGAVSVSAEHSSEVSKYSRKHFTKELCRKRFEKRLGATYLAQVTETEQVVLNEEVFNLEVDGAHHYVAGEVVVHNCNKDPNKSFGDVELSVWHDGMKRVELVIAVDRDRAKEHGAEDVCDKLDRGLFPDVSMGCLPATARILGANGRYVMISDVKEGDEIISHRGRACRVSSTMTRPHKGSIYTIKAFGIRKPLVLTEEHPLWLVRESEVACHPSPTTLNKGRKQRVCTPTSYHDKKGCSGCKTRPSYKFDWVRADEAREGDYLATPVPVFESSLHLSMHEARLLGYYLSEGHICYGSGGLRRAVVFSTNINEVETHTELFEIACALGVKDKYTWWDAPERNARYVVINDAHLADLCADHCGTGAKEKVLSSELMGVDTDTLKLLLGSYANGDGGAYKGSLYFSAASEELSEQLCLVLARCGMIASVNEILHKPSKNSVVQKETVEYQVWVGTDTAHRLTTSRLSLASSERQNSKRFFYEHEGTTYLLSPIELIEETPYDDLVYNFSVAEDESYVAEGLAVHNCKVPYDLCSVCTDWDKYRRAQASFDPSLHRTIGQAVLAWHRRDPIRGVSVTRNDYCEHLRTMLNKILGDGRRICAINDYPRFFDISFVFIGADKTAKVMAKLAFANAEVIPSWMVAEQVGYQQPETDKGFEKVASRIRAVRSTASKASTGLPEKFSRRGTGRKKEKRGLEGVVAKLREKSASHHKGAAIIKDIIPSQFGGKVVPAHLSEIDLPNAVLDRLGAFPLESALSTPSHMGIMLKPREFQRIIIIRMGRKPLADALDHDGLIFGPTDTRDDSLSFGADDFSSKIMQMLLPFLNERSHFEPVIKRRIVKITLRPADQAMKEYARGEGPELSEDTKPRFVEGDPLLDKISAAYNSYLDQMVKCAAEAEPVIDDNPELWSKVYDANVGEWFSKTADLNPKVLLGALGATYLLSAYGRHRERRAMYEGREPPNAVLQWLADHPHLSAILVGLGVAHIGGPNFPRKLVESGKDVVKHGVEVARKI